MNKDLIKKAFQLGYQAGLQKLAAKDQEGMWGDPSGPTKPVISAPAPNPKPNPYVPIMPNSFQPPRGYGGFQGRIRRAFNPRGYRSWVWHNMSGLERFPYVRDEQRRFAKALADNGIGVAQKSSE